MAPNDTQNARKRKRTVQAARQSTDATTRHEDADPSKGGPGYPFWVRQRTLAANDAGATVASLGRETNGPHERSIRRWNARRANGRGIAREPSTGGAPRRFTDRDVALVHIAQRIWPTLMNREIRNLVAHVTGTVLDDPKVARIRKDHNPYATTSRQVVQSHAIEHCPVLRQMWRTMPPPYGHVGVHRQRMIDHDECGLYITKTQRGWGYALIGHRPVEEQIYEKHLLFTLVMGISPSGEYFYEIIRDGGVNGPRFIRYLEHFVFPHCGPQRVHMWDNLRSHLTPAVHASTAAAGHTSLARPPYTPHWGPIEFIFGVIEAHLRRYQYIASRANFERLIRIAIQRAVTPATCDAAFRHCGY